MPLFELLARLGVALFIGAAIGLERELRSKDAGLRTHTLVTLGAATYMLIAEELVIRAQLASGQMLDPLRVLGALIGGIGFLAAGVILQRRGGVRGLTTAASLWMSAALGAAAGLGQYRLSLVAVVTTVLVLWPIQWVERAAKNGRHKGASGELLDDRQEYDRDKKSVGEEQRLVEGAPKPKAVRDTQV